MYKFHITKSGIMPDQVCSGSPVIKKPANKGITVGKIINRVGQRQLPGNTTMYNPGATGFPLQTSRG
jgi:hypothetical protein